MMVMTNIPIRDLEAVRARLEQEGHQDPLQAHYIVSVQVNGDAYRLSILPQRRKLMALQAVRIRGNEPLLLLTKAPLLLALLELWLASEAA